MATKQSQKKAVTPKTPRKTKGGKPNKNGIPGKRNTATNKSTKTTKGTKKRAVRDGTAIPVKTVAFLISEVLWSNSSHLDEFGNRMFALAQEGKPVESLFEDKELVAAAIQKRIDCFVTGALWASSYPLLKSLEGERPGGLVVKIFYSLIRLHLTGSGAFKEEGRKGNDPDPTENDEILYDQVFPMAEWLDDSFRQKLSEAEAQGDEAANNYEWQLREDSIAFYKRNKKVMNRCARVFLQLIKDFPNYEQIESELKERFANN